MTEVLLALILIVIGLLAPVVADAAEDLEAIRELLEEDGW